MQARITCALKRSRIGGLIGPRQSGKTTLARHIVPSNSTNYFDLEEVLRVLADRKPLRARFLILGIASPNLLRQSSESLAGRIEIIPVGGFSLDEVGAKVVSAAAPRAPRAIMPKDHARRVVEGRSICPLHSANE